MCILLRMYTLYVCVCVYVYIYIERERPLGRNGGTKKELLPRVYVSETIKYDLALKILTDPKLLTLNPSQT